jgi:hypothetical protein
VIRGDQTIDSASRFHPCTPFSFRSPIKVSLRWAATLFLLALRLGIQFIPDLAEYIGEHRLAGQPGEGAIGGLFAMQTIHKPDITVR